MYIKKKTLVISSIILIIVVSVGTFFVSNPFGITNIKDYFKFRMGLGALNNYYYEEIDTEKLVDGILAGAAISTEDPYTSYMTKEMAERYMETVDSDDYTGVGLTISNDITDNTVLVVSPLSDTPAEKAGIVSGDKILEVDGEKVYGEDLDNVAEKMKGTAGTDVTLNVLKKATGESIDIKLTRAVVKRETVEYKMVTKDIGYIDITQFGLNTYDEFAKGFNSLVDEGMKKLVIDLRNNPGGYLEMAVNIADIFLEEDKTIVYTMNKKGKKNVFYSTEGAIEIPIVMLSNEGTASASEILIASLRDNGKAKLVGEKTFGKGVTQIPFILPDNSLIKITDSRYYTPKDKCIDKEGILPDYEIEMSDEKYADLSNLSISEDDQLLMAIECFND